MDRLSWGLAICCALMQACHSSQKISSSPEPDNSSITAGQSFIENNDCLTCHGISEKLVGPSFQMIALRYPNPGRRQTKKLARKILEGGSGNWGRVPMTPHPGLTEQYAQNIISYIHSLKK